MLRAVSSSQPIVSIEYFPPKGLPAERGLITGAHALRRFEPDYQTVTFGAGGSATEGALEWAGQLQRLNEVPTACHIALCHFEGRDELNDFADELWEEGIERLVILRGDGDTGKLAGYSTVADAVANLKARHGFDISVAAYPEVHPKAESQKADIDVLLAKQDAGADRAITQYFFENDLFYRFRDLAAAAGLKIDLVPGVMPITDFTKIKNFSERCGATVPKNFDERFAAAGDDQSNKSAVSRELIETQVRDLARNSVEQLHVYSLNRVDLTACAIRAFRDEFGDDTMSQTAPAIAS